MSKPNLQLLDYLASKGVQFVINDGGGNYWAVREDIEEYLDDPDAVFAKKLGVTKFEYRDWREAGGCVRCPATLRNGKQCSRLVAGPFLSAHEWLERRKQPEYCRKHSEGTASVRGLSVRAS